MVASSSRSIDDERKFRESGYEVRASHEDCTKAEDGIKKELHVMKKQHRNNMKLHR